MNGLLDGFSDFIKTPEGQGLLSAAFGGLAGARRGQPINSLGRAGLAGLSGYAGAQEQQSQAADRAFKAMQQTRMQKDWQKEDAMTALAAQFMQPGQPGVEARSATDAVESALPPNLQIPGMPAIAAKPAQPPKFDAAGYSNALMGIDPAKGAAFAQSMAKDSMFGKVDAKDYTPESVAKFAQSRSFGDLVPRSKMEVSSGGAVFDPYAIKPGAFLADPNKPMMMTAGGAVPNIPFQNYEMGKAAAGASRTTNQLINAGPKAFETELGKLDAKQLDEWRNGALAAKNTILTAKKLDDAAANGAYSGGAANLKMTVGSYINGLTGATPKGQIGSELYTAEANNLILAQIKQLGTNPSNADLAFIQKTVPQLSTNAEARKQMTQFMREKAQSSIELYQRADTHARKNSGLGGFQDIQSSGGVDDLVKKYGGR